MTVPVPGLARRLAAFLYEGILLFAVAVITGLVTRRWFSNAMRWSTGRD